MRRVLAPSGRFLLSTHHPTADARLHSPDDYFAVIEVTEEWGGEEWGGKRCPVSFWRRPLTAMAEAITAAGFAIVRLVEPRPDPALEEIDPSAYHRLGTQPGFLFFEIGPRPSSWG